MAKLNISQKKAGVGPFIDTETATELAKEWIMSNRNRRRNMTQEYDLMPLFSKVRGGEIKIGVSNDLQQKPNMIVPGLDTSGNLIFLRGYPNTKMFSPRDFYDTRKKKNQTESIDNVSEQRQYQLRAFKKDGKEDVSEWYDDEDTVYEMKKKIDELETYESSEVYKRIKEMEEKEENSPTLEAKVRGGPKGKGKPLGTQVHKDKKKEKSKKAARKKVRVKENFDLHEGITSTVLNALENYLDSLFSSLGVDINFTKHFLQRVNDERNRRPITYAELNKMFRKVYKKYGERIAQMTDQAQAVITDMSSDINMPFIIKHDTRNQELDLVAKTVMRKKNFMTPNPRLRVESNLD